MKTYEEMVEIAAQNLVGMRKSGLYLDYECNTTRWAYAEMLEEMFGNEFEEVNHTINRRRIEIEREAVERAE